MKKIFTIISALALIWGQILAPTIILAQEATASAEPIVEVSPSPTPSESPQPTPTPSSETEATPSATPTPTPEPGPNPSPAANDWTAVSDNTATTKDNVVLDHLYAAPQNSKVTLKFNKLPENPGKLTIKEVTLTDQQMAETGALSKIAYDISSTMADGTFEYTLTLPTPKTDNVEVKSSEDGQSFITLGGVTAQTDTLTITGLNHFTIFVVASPAGNTSQPPGDIMWTLGDTRLSNDTYATVGLGAGNISHYLWTNNYGLSIPTGATILGIKVNVERKCSSSTDCVDHSVRLIKGGTVSGNEKADTVTNYPTTDTVKSYGGDTDLWGLTWTPADLNSADFGVAFAAKNTGGVSNTVSVDTIQVVIGYNRPPVANNRSVSTPEDVAIPINLIATDADNDVLTYTIVTNPAKGTLSGTPPFLTYTPNLNSNGADSFTFKVNDGTIDSDTATVSIDVTAVNDPPTITLNNPNGGEIFAGGTQDIGINWTAVDVDGGTLNVEYLRYTTDNGASYTTIANNLPNSGAYPWTIPSINSTTVKVEARVCDAAGACANDSSNTNFTIDTTGPDTSALNPSISPFDFNNYYIKGIVGVAGYVTDSVAVESVNFNINDFDAGGDSEFSCNGVRDLNDPNIWSCAIDTTTLPDSSEQSYDMRVTATDTAGNPTTDYYSNWDDYFDIDNTKPTNVTVSDSGAKTTDPHLSFNWPPSQDDASGLSYYQFWLSTATNESSALDLDPNSANKWINISDVTDYTLTDTQAALLTAGSQYFAKVKGVDFAGNVANTNVSSWSNGITYDVGTIIIVKDTVPDDPQDFTFTRSFGANFSLDDDNNNTLPKTVTFANIPSGQYTVTENQVNGWKLTNLTCRDSDNGSSTNISTRTASIDLDPGNIITCTFTNTKLGHITLTTWKDADADGTWDEGELPFGIGQGDMKVKLEEAIKTLTSTPNPVEGQPPIMTEEIIYGGLRILPTNENGQTSFEVDHPGTYRLTPQPPTGYLETFPVDSFFDITYRVDFVGQTITHDDKGRPLQAGIAPYQQIGGSGTKFVPTSGDSSLTISLVVIDPAPICPGGACVMVEGQPVVSNVVPQNGTVITRSDGEMINLSQLGAQTPNLGDLTGLGNNVVVDGALQWGIPNFGLEFSLPITLNIFVGASFNGQTLNVVRSTTGTGGWTSDGIVPPATCTVVAGICTFQATKASYYATTHTSSTSSIPSTSGGGSLSAASAPSCGDQKPASAPTLVSAAASTNSVTLAWNKAMNPVTYYLATYGLSSGQQQYGHPNIGGADTTSYTVQGLSGGVTYYFKVRAGNGCAPGDFSNELSATPGGAVVSGPAAGFAPGVLGTTSDQENVAGEQQAGEVQGETTLPESSPLTSPSNPIATIFQFLGSILTWIKSWFNP